MRAFKLSSETDDYKAYNLDDAGLEAVNEFFCRPSEGRWQPIRLFPHRQNKRVPAGDFPCIFVGTMPALSQRATDALRDLLEPAGELLPVECPEGSLWLFNCLRFADVLDEERSEIRRYPDGALAHVYRHEWKAAVEHETFFRIPQRRPPVYVTDVVVERIRGAGLVGYELVE